MLATKINDEQEEQQPKEEEKIYPATQIILREFQKQTSEILNNILTVQKSIQQTTVMIRELLEKQTLPQQQALSILEQSILDTEDEKKTSEDGKSTTNEETQNKDESTPTSGVVLPAQDCGDMNLPPQESHSLPNNNETTLINNESTLVQNETTSPTKISEKQIIIEEKKANVSQEQTNYLIIPPIETNEVLNFADFYCKNKNNIFIETGTGRLDGVRAAIRAGFKDIRTVEAKDTYIEMNSRDLKESGYQESYTATHRLFVNGDVQISCFHGMSKDHLEIMMSDFKEESTTRNNVVFWLDAHVSGPESAGHEDFLAKGSASDYAQHNVLLSELQIIFTKSNNLNNYMILIDDQNDLAESLIYAKMIEQLRPNTYKFLFFDEQRGEILQKNKILACIPF